MFHEIDSDSLSEEPETHLSQQSALPATRAVQVLGGLRQDACSEEVSGSGYSPILSTCEAASEALCPFSGSTVLKRD